MSVGGRRIVVMESAFLYWRLVGLETASESGRHQEPATTKVNQNEKIAHNNRIENAWL